MKIRYAWIVFVLAAALLAGAAAHAADKKMGIYGAVKGGWSGTTYTKNGLDNLNLASTQNANATNESFKTPDQYVFGGAIGYNWAASFNIPIRSELEYMYRGNMLKYGADNGTAGSEVSSKVTSIQTLFANFFYDINTGTAFTPYVGAGVGLAWIDTKYSSTAASFANWEGDKKTTATNFAWNVGAGLGYSVTDNFILDLGYRYVSFGSSKAYGGAVYDQKFKNLGAHEVLLGLRFEF